MDIAIRPLSKDDLDEYMRVASLAFGFTYSQDIVESERAVFEAERSAGAYEGDRMVGGTLTASLRLSVPGEVVSVAALTSASVIPTHRRRGVLRALMQHHFEEARAREEPVSILWATEGAIYGRFGYGTGTMAARFEIERIHGRFAEPHRPAGPLRVVERDEAIKLFPPVYDRVQPHQPGMIAWDPTWWRYGYTHPEHFHEGKPTFVLHETDGEADGFLVYRFRPKWKGAHPAGTVDVDELIAATPGAYADLWRYLLDMDLVERIVGHPFRVEEPVLHLLAEPRRLRLRIGDGLWVRPVDAAAALRSRRYAVEGRLRISVRDALCPWNETTLELRGGPQGAECGPASGEPDLVVGASELGAAYLGGPRFRTLAEAGRITEVTPGAIRRADQMFVWDPPPWAPTVF